MALADALELDDMAQAYGRTPAQVMGFVESGLSPWTCLDFNRAIFRLARRIRTRAHETIDEWVTAEKPPSPNMVRSHRPRYRMLELLVRRAGEGTELDDAPAKPIPGLPDLPTSGL